MRRALTGLLFFSLAIAACENDVLVVDGDTPAAPVAVAATYYAGSVRVSWEHGAGWDGEPFRIYSRRVTDSDFFFIAEVTSCISSFCLYEDLNVLPGETYEYYVAALSDSGVEAESVATAEVFVPQVTPPPVPDAMGVIALDNANYLTWGAASRSAGDFSHYKVYLDDAGSSLLLGETDSEGFLDLLAVNGASYSYFVTSVDADGHESTGSVAALGTPRPDFTGEWLWADSDVPAGSGFVFVPDEATNPVVAGSDPLRHFRLETDVDGWWLVPGPGTGVLPTGFLTTALKCGVAADAACVDVPVAPTTGYVTDDVSLAIGESYVLRVVGDDDELHYGVIRVAHLGFDQNDDAIAIFDWAYQLQAGNPALVGEVGG